MKKYIYISFLVLCSFANAAEPENEHPEERRVIPRSLSDSNIILGEYVFLRPTFPDDYRHFVDFFSTQKCIRHWGSGDTKTGIEVMEMFTDEAVETKKQYPSEHHWTICCHNGVAGKIMLFDFYDKNERNTEIAYYMLPAYQGRKYTTHAGKLVLSFAHSNWPDDKPFYIEATVHPENIASASVLTKLGFKPDSERVLVPRYGSIRNYYELASYDDGMTTKKHSTKN